NAALGARVTAKSRAYEIPADDASFERERARLLALCRWRDPSTIRALTDIGVAPGWSCLEAGAGSGGVARGLAERVAPNGSVLSGDVDLRFHCDPVPGMEIRRLDVRDDPLPAAAFDVVHARALFQHIPEREQVLERFIAAAKPGGWIVIEDSDWRAFEAQRLPEPLATVARIMHQGGRMRSRWDPDIGSQLVPMFRERGLVDLDVRGETRTMHGADFTGEWWYLGIEHAADMLLASGAATREQIDG